MKKTVVDHAVLPAIENRWSPRAFDANKPVSSAVLARLFEAARWSASSYNEQPWRFFVGIKGEDSWERIFGLINEWNQKWAVNAPVLVFSAIKTHFSHNNTPNRAAMFDLGAATAHLALQAVELDIYVHQMAGVHLDQARAVLGIPDGFEAQFAFALGYRAEPEILLPEYRKSETAPRTRKPVADFVFTDRFGEAFPL
jgi:nitroreductase